MIKKGLVPPFLGCVPRCSRFWPPVALQAMPSPAAPLPPPVPPGASLSARGGTGGAMGGGPLRQWVSGPPGPGLLHMGVPRRAAGADPASWPSPWCCAGRTFLPCIMMAVRELLSAAPVLSAFDQPLRPWGHYGRQPLDCHHGDLDAGGHRGDPPPVAFESRRLTAVEQACPTAHILELRAVAHALSVCS